MKKVLINVEERELRVAILEDDQLVELYIESLEGKSILNNIYKGRIEGVLPGLKAAFVNVGLEKNAFLHFDDVRNDLLLKKYHEMNPEFVPPEEVVEAVELEPVAVEALSEGEVEGGEEEDGDLKRKRRRGRRGGKKRLREAEDTYTPGLPRGVTEDDLEDDEEEEGENDTPSDIVEDDDQPSIAAEPVAAVAALDGDAQTQARQLDANERRNERRQRRRDRWEQKKIERQQRRAQGLPAQSSPHHSTAQPAAQPTGNYRAPQQAMPPQISNWTPPPVRGSAPTRATANPYEVFSPYAQPQRGPQQRRQRMPRNNGNDNFGNVKLDVSRPQDRRDSQEDFFGANIRPAQLAGGGHAHDYMDYYEDENYAGAAPGNEKFPVARPMRSLGGDSRRPSNNAGNNANNKRRGGKNRSMRKRGGGQSYYAAKVPKTPITEALDEVVLPMARAKKTDSAAKKVSAKPAPKKAPTQDDLLGTSLEVAVMEDAPKKGRAKKTADAVDTSATAPVKKTRAKKAVDTTDAQSPEPEVDAVAETVSKPVRAKRVSARGNTAIAAKNAEATSEAAKAELVETKQAEVITEVQLDAAGDRAITDDGDKDTVIDNATGLRVPRNRKERRALEREKLRQARLKALAEGGVLPKKKKLKRVEPAAEVAPIADAVPVAEIPVQGEAQPPAYAEAVNKETLAESQVREEPVEVTAEPFDASGETDVREEASQTNQPESRHPRDRRPPRGGRNRPGDPRRGAPAVTVAPGVPVTVLPAVHTRQDNRRPPREVQPPARRIRMPQFTEVFAKGDELMVQVVKEEIGMKGARISTFISLPGRYLVMLPYPNEEGGISRKVEDEAERRRLKALLRDISDDQKAFIIRTAGIFREESEIRSDVDFLNGEWKTIDSSYAKSQPTELVYDDHDILYKLARDVFDDNVSEILVDSFTEGEKLRSILSKLIPGLVEKVQVYSGPENIFQKYGVEKQIQKAARRKVWLKSGGYLIIDEAEALAAIDVNTGKSVGKNDQEKLILKTNIEAARAVARELKLRDIGGLIVIDFIDMKDRRNRDQVLSELKAQLRKDRSKTSVSAISEFGLVEMTRKRVRRSLRKTLFMDCPYCQGAGVVLNEQQIWLQIKHELVQHLEMNRSSPNVQLTVNPKIRAYLDQNYRDSVRKLEQRYDAEIKIGMSDAFHIENYTIEDEKGTISGAAQHSNGSRAN